MWYFASIVFKLKMRYNFSFSLSKIRRTLIRSVLKDAVPEWYVNRPPPSKRPVTADIMAAVNTAKKILLNFEIKKRAFYELVLLSVKSGNKNRLSLTSSPN